MRRAAAALLLLVAACSDDGDDGAVERTTTTTLLTTSSSSTSTTCAPPSDDAVAVVDLDGDGVDERWVPAGRGASVEILALEHVDGCTTEPVTVDGVPAEFAVGGTVLLLQGVRCDDGQVVHLGATSEDGETYTTLDIVYELRGGELVRVDDRTGTLSASDPDLQAYSSFDCGF